MYSKVIQLFFSRLSVDIQFFQHHLLKKLIFSILLPFLLCQRSVDSIFVGLFVGSLFSSTNIFVVLQILHYLDCCYSVARSCPTLHDPMDCSMTGFSIIMHVHICMCVYIYIYVHTHICILSCCLASLFTLIPSLWVITEYQTRLPVLFSNFLLFEKYTKLT